MTISEAVIRTMAGYLRRFSHLVHECALVWLARKCKLSFLRHCPAGRWRRLLGPLMSKAKWNGMVPIRSPLCRGCLEPNLAVVQTDGTSNNERIASLPGFCEHAQHSSGGFVSPSHHHPHISVFWVIALQISAPTPRDGGSNSLTQACQRIARSLKLPVSSAE
jgi:hypothetical protein